MSYARRRRHIGEDGNSVFDVPQTTESKFNILTSGSCVSVAIWFGIISVLVILIAVIAVVPDYGGGVRLEFDTTAFPPLTTTTAPATTTVVTTAAPTTPPPAIVLTCPQNDVETPLGFPLTGTTFGVTFSGGCPPLTQSTTDTLVGSIAKREHFRYLEAPIRGNVQGETRVARGIHVKRPIPPSFVALKTASEPRSPSFPGRQISVTSSTPIANNGNALQPDFAMDSNINVVVTASNTNTGGAQVQVYTKSMVELGGSPFSMSALAQGSNPCAATGAMGQAQVMWDRFAGRWILMEVAVNSTLCLYASDGSSPLLSSYTLYALTFPVQPETPKLALMNDYYTISFVHGNTSALVIVDRTAIVTQQMSVSYFSVPAALPNLVGITPSTWTPLDNRGETPVPGNISTGVTFMRQRDNSLDPAAPLPIQDFLDVIVYDDINFGASNASSTAYSIPLTNFDSSGARFCIPVPDNSTLLYAGQEWLSSRLSFNGLAPPYAGQYRIVGTFTTQACTGARLQWFELTFNYIARQWQIRQQGVSPATPGLFLWMSAITQDKYGNMLLIYSNSSAANLNYYPSLGAFSRSADDPLGTMRYAQGSLVWSQGEAPAGPVNGTWGVASQAIADPTESVGRTFYALGSRTRASTWEGVGARIRMQGEIVQRNVIVEDQCGQVATCEFFILDGQV